MATLKRAALTFLGFVAGSLAGVAFVRLFPQLFPGEPPWLIPAIVVGVTGLAVVAVLTLPALTRLHRRKQDHANVP